MRPDLRSFAGKRDGASTIEFVVIFVGFVAIMFFVMEVTLYLFFVSSLEKAAQAGVRLAVVSPPVVASGFPRTNRPRDSDDYGKTCRGRNNGRNPCEVYNGNDHTCDGGSNCQSNAFDRIVNHMRGFNGQIGSENVRIRYDYPAGGIGFAGGPAVPMVTVTVKCVPFQGGIVSLIGIDVNQADDWGCDHEDGELVLPPRSASMTGEDLN